MIYMIVRFTGGEAQTIGFESKDRAFDFLCWNKDKIESWEVI